MRKAISETARLVLAQIHVYGIWAWDPDFDSDLPPVALYADPALSVIPARPLAALMRRGLVEETTEDGRRSLKVTPAGLTVLNERPEIISVVQEQSDLAHALARGGIGLKISGRNNARDRLHPWLSNDRQARS